MRGPMSELPIRFETVSLRAGAVRILDRVDLTLAPGTPTLVIGPNGSGKSSLIRLGARLAAPTDGRITWGGREDGGAACAIVLQQPVMLRRSAAANVAYALPRGADRSARVAALMRHFGLQGLETRPARRLSGGERQRLALARALARDPAVLFLDEPTASLDPAATLAVENLVRATAASGVKIVMATHDLAQARRLAGDVVMLARGRVVEHADATRFFSHPASPQAAAFLRGEIVI